MAMETLRLTTDTREFDTIVRRMRYQRSRFSPQTEAEIEEMRWALYAKDETVSLLHGAIADQRTGSAGRVTAPTVAIAIMALENISADRSEMVDWALENTGNLDSWGWSSEDTSESEVSWRVAIEIVSEDSELSMRFLEHLVNLGFTQTRAIEIGAPLSTDTDTETRINWRRLLLMDYAGIVEEYGA